MMDREKVPGPWPEVDNTDTREVVVRKFAAETVAKYLHFNNIDEFIQCSDKLANFLLIGYKESTND